MEFKVGQKYRVGAKGCEYGNIIEIVKVNEATKKDFTIQTYKTIKGKKVLGASRSFDNYSPFAKSLIPVHNECIVIYRKGNETIALDKTTGKKAVATCSPDDTYDFYKGAQLAFNRLTVPTGEEPKNVNFKCAVEPQYFNGFVQCVKNGYKNRISLEGFTVGNIYEVKGGYITSDDGWTCKGPRANIEDLCSGMGHTFKEIKKVKRIAKAGEYVEIIKAGKVPHTNGKPDYKDGDILKIICAYYNQARYAEQEESSDRLRVLHDDEYVVLEGYEPIEKEPEFKPYLRGMINHYGIIGSKTPLKDVLNRELKVGDTVDIYNENGTCYGEYAVVCDNEKAFIMSIKESCRPDGTIVGWKAIKKRSFSEISNGEKVDDITYVKERAQSE